MTSTERDTGTLVLVAVVGVRVAAIGLVAASLLFGPAAHGVARTAQLLCFVLGTAAVLGWGLLARQPARHPTVVVTAPRTSASRWPAAVWIGLFATMAAAAVGCSTEHGRALVCFALLAAAAAGAVVEFASAWLVAGVGILAIIVGAILADAGGVSTLGSCLEVVVALLLGHARQSHRIQADQANRLLAQADRLRVEQAATATLAERARIAREIHDVLAHSLGALNIQIQAARALLSEQHDAEGAGAVLERAQRLTADGLDETRRAVQALHSDSRPLDRELAALADEHRATHRVAVTVQASGDVRPLRRDSALALLRVAQESLVNAAKHSPGQPVTVGLSYDERGTRLCVSNPIPSSGGREMQGSQLRTIDSGFGLSGMRERLLLLHGSLIVQTRMGCWEVIAQVPA